MSLSTPQQVMERLDAIERDLAERQNEYERAAHDKAKLIRDFEHRLARARVVAQGKDADTRKANALLAVAAAEDGLYDRLAEAEGAFEGCKAAVRVMEHRVGIGQSLLKAQGRA